MPDSDKFDPPTRFDAAAGGLLDVTAEPAEVLLHQNTVVVPMHRSDGLANEEVRLVDAGTGKLRTVVRATHHLPSGSRVEVRPALVAVDGTTSVLIPFLGETPGEGTTPGRFVIELLSVDPVAGTTNWTTTITIAPRTEAALPSDTDVSVVGATDGIGIIRLSSRNDESRALAVNLTTHTEAWRTQGFEAVAVADGVVAGTKPDKHSKYDEKILGVDARTGQQRWVSPRNTSVVTASSGGPTYFVATGYDNDGDRPFFDVMATATGRVVRSTLNLGAERRHLSACRYDDRSTTVCGSLDWVGALDATTGRWLWSFTKDNGRLVPTVTGAWHGAVYGRTDNGPLVLDARTGADRETRPGVAPSVVNGRLGVGPSKYGSGASVYPALG
ncbi:hypothetical protein [Krasilnikovia sp. MM14-A1259]|uniref:hypothetical protein n=1 Tax=Krasilnikovia sp. MM14-A1259 TaxID=3373539 RepID=UPI0038181203